MYEKSTKISKGLSLGGGVDSSFRSGTTLYRKVRSVQYGPEGEAYYIDLDLGAIPKAVKEIAKKYDYMLKTVIVRIKAMYPVGSVAGSIEYRKVEEKFAGNGLSRSSLIGLGIFVVLVVLLYLLMEVSLVAWVLAFISFSLLFYSPPLLKFVLRLFLLMVSFIVLFIVGVLSSNLNTFRVSDNGGNQVVDKSDEYIVESTVDNSRTVVGITLAKPANWDFVKILGDDTAGTGGNFIFTNLYFLLVVIGLVGCWDSDIGKLTPGS